MGKMYRISEVGGLMGVNPKTLRYYEEEGVLVPTCVDERTGYRYYDQQAILCLWQTLIMRDAGMSIRDLKDVWEGRDIEGQIARLKRRMTAIRTTVSLLKQLEQQSQGYRVVENSLPGGLYLRHKLVAKGPDEIFSAFMTLFDMALDRGLEVDRRRPPFARFTDIVFQHENIHCEVYMPVVSGLVGGDVVRVEIPRAVSTVHHGDYSMVEAAYDVLQDYVDTHDLDIVDCPMEFYVFGLQDPQRKKLTTTVFFPVA